MRRQLRAQGGIMSVAPREKFGIGSTIKDRIRKLIPNELADVAVKAAPFIAPFYPGYAAIARGLGRFDQRGSISDALKQGAATYGFGKVAGKLGGAEGSEMGNIFGRQKYSMEGFKNEGVGRLFKGASESNTSRDVLNRKMPGDPEANIYKNIETKPTGIMKRATEATIDKLPFTENLPQIVKEKLLVGGITSGASALYGYFSGEFEPQEPGETMGEYLARRNTRVKQQMKSYMDSYYTPLRNPQYAAMSDEQKNNYIDSIVGQTSLQGTTDYQGEAKATGGRVGYQTGGISMTNTAAQNRAINNARRAQNQEQLQKGRNMQRATQLLNQAGGSSGSIGGLTDLYNKYFYGKGNLGGSAFQGNTAGKTSYTSKDRSQIIKDIAYQLGQQGGNQIGQQGAPQVSGSGAPRQKSALELKIEENKRLFNEYIKNNPSTINPDPSLLGNPGVAKLNTPGTTGTTSTLEPAYINKDLLSKLTMLTPEEAYGGETFDTLSDLDQYNFAQAFTQLQPQLRDSSYVSPYGAPSGRDIFSRRYGIKDGGQVAYNQGGRVGFSEGSNLKIKLKQIGYEDTLLDGMSIKELRELLDSEKGTFTDQGTYRKPANMGGIMGGSMPMGEPRVNQGGITELDYRAKGGFVPVGIKEKADDVPAMLSKNEFVFTADAVRGAGNGSIENGAQKMYDTMKNLERRVT